MSDLTGQTIAHYKLHDCVGESTSGIVFRGTDTHTGKLVAIQISDCAQHQRLLRRFDPTLDTRF